MGENNNEQEQNVTRGFFAETLTEYDKAIISTIQGGDCQNSGWEVFVKDDWRCNLKRT